MTGLTVTIEWIRKYCLNYPAYLSIRHHYGISYSVREAISNDPYREKALIESMEDTGYYQSTWYQEIRRGKYDCGRRRNRPKTTFNELGQG